MQYGLEYCFLGWIVWIILYTGISLVSLKKMKNTIKEIILNI